MEINKRIGLLLTGLCLLFGTGVRAQGTLYATSTGQTSFHASAPAEDIDAINKKTQATLNISTGEIVVLINMRAFSYTHLDVYKRQHIGLVYVLEPFPVKSFH